MEEKEELTAEDVRELIRQEFGSRRGSLMKASRQTGAHISHLYNFMEGRYAKNPPVAVMNYLGIEARLVFRRKGKGNGK